MEVWTNNDLYLNENLVEADIALKNALAVSRKNNLPEWEISATQGKFLNLLVKMRNAKRILEIGTLGGYSTIWLARAIPSDGLVVSLEYDKLYSDVARKNIEYLIFRCGKLFFAFNSLNAVTPVVSGTSNSLQIQYYCKN